MNYIHCTVDVGSTSLIDMNKLFSITRDYIEYHNRLISEEIKTFLNIN